MADKEVLLVGGFHEVIELLEAAGMSILGVIDPRQDAGYGYQVLGSDENAARIRREFPNVPLVLSPDSPHRRVSLVAYYRDLGFRFSAVVHPTAILSRSCRIGTGAMIHAGAHVSAEVSVGDFSKIGAFANVMHDSVIGDFTTIAPNAVVLGRVRIGGRSYIGANSTLLPDISLGEEVVVGAGAVVTRAVEGGLTVAGVPARELRK